MQDFEIERVAVELYASYDKVKDELTRVDTRAFGVTTDTPEEMEKLVKKSRLLAVARYGDDKRMIGYSLVTHRWRHTAYIEYTAVEDTYQGMGVARKLNEAVEAELKRIGYQYIERDARVINGYADKLRDAYQDRVIATHEHESYYGQTLRFFRIVL